MKALALFLLLSFSATSQASYYNYSCSNPDATVHWEDSHGVNTFFAGYWERGELKHKEFDLGDVTIKKLKKHTIKKERLGTAQCPEGSEHTYYTAVVVTPKESIKEEFKKYLGAKVEDTVLCLNHESSEPDCK